jgi:hypothetical protein
VRLRIPNIEITRHPAPNAAEDLADKKSSVTDPYRDNDLLLDDHHRSPVDIPANRRHPRLFSELSFLDSAALSGLLIVHRRASQSGVALHLDLQGNLRIAVDGSVAEP